MFATQHASDGVRSFYIPQMETALSTNGFNKMDAHGHDVRPVFRKEKAR
jgi:hypothetical protein